MEDGDPPQPPASPPEDPRMRRQVQGRVLILAICAAGIGGSFQYGYNLTIINAPTQPIQAFINQTWLERTGAPLAGPGVTLAWSLAVSLFPLGGLAGALLAGPLALRLGRKKSLLLNNAFVLLSAVMVVSSRAAKAFEMILLGRFLAGVNAGVGMSIQPMYLGESAPKDLRGSVALTSASFTALGLVAGQVVGLKEVLGAEEAWPLLLASNALPALIQLLLLPWAPESPRFLLIDRGDPDSCLAALRSLRGGGDLAAEMKELLAEGAAVQGKTPPAPWDLFCDRSIRRQLLSIVVLSSAMQLCGNDSMYSYASYIFRAAGIPEDKIQYWIIGTGTCELLTAVTCTLVIERSGRRALVVSGYSLMAVWAVIFMVALSLQDRLPWAPYLSMACIFAYILSFGIGPAGVTGIIPTEIFDQVSRPAAYVVSGSLLWTSLFLVGTAFPFIVEGLGHFCYLPFLAVCVCTALYVGLFLPETKGKTFLEISEEFRKCNFGGGPKCPLRIPGRLQRRKRKRRGRDPLPCSLPRFPS
ncbi:LOW QUALITY PROTEIN: solute carrier family 2, facilitated glucose transporter member 11-like [Sceloporus undulatus]|uniref:LOW QUALITY PROTEIN: solute carrier family 2, facilitated glucose transporter member 11-like n=1 Tax=Sceloporus undulatus TaxID=8520 RepID=UPI001C4D0219|nr:LOW QUALITY PROTEIN: solute carrier family 2, facilitated glucose transporter member 11-like [Sceloporus undulatus]